MRAKPAMMQERTGLKTRHYRGGAVSCFCRAGGIYSPFALKRVARRGGRKPTFLLGRLECSADRLGPRSLCVDLEKIRGAAERVARSVGLEIVDVEWEVGEL